MNDKDLSSALIRVINDQAFRVFCEIRTLTDAEASQAINEQGPIQDAFRSLRSQMIKDLDANKDTWIRELAASLTNNPTDESCG